MTLEELEAKRVELIAQRDVVIAELKSITRQRDLTYETQIANTEVANMSDARKTALLQAIGVDPTSVVGTPG